MKHVVKAALMLFAVCGLAFSQAERPKAALCIAGNAKDRGALRLLVNNFLVQSGKFQMIDAAAVDAAAGEQGVRLRRANVSDADIAKVGAAAGADFVCVVTQIRRGEGSLINLRMISAESGQTLQSSAVELPSGGSIAEVVQGAVGSLLDMPLARGMASGSGFSDENFGIDMILVQGGTFSMGCTPEQGGDCDNDESPVHSVTVSDFYVAKYEVTQKLWALIMGNNPTSDPGDRGDNKAVVDVSWNDVQTFLTRLNERTGRNYRLPTEAEWEFAARGGNSSQGFKYSGSNNVNEVGWHGGNSGGNVQPVGTLQPNELGIYDMSGNVREMLSSWYGRYTAEAKTDPAGPNSGNSRGERGGDHLDEPAKLRVSYRDGSRPSSSYSYIGFRLFLTP